MTSRTRTGAYDRDRERQSPPKFAGYRKERLIPLNPPVWFGNLEIATVMAVAMFANLLIAGLSGTLVPIGLLRAGVDPAVASSVFVTTITDVVGFFVFLGLAALYLM